MADQEIEHHATGLRRAVSEGKKMSQRPPPESWEVARQAALKLVRPLESFLKIQAASGIVLLIAAIVAMTWANSPWQESYHHLWHTPVAIELGSFRFAKDLHFVINDGLMVIFFFVVGLEIRREIHGGELSELKRAALPVAAAIGGMVVPALVYLAFNPGPETSHGWGVPMATDIAFAVGILTLLGKRVPAALRVLLLALAIIDDIGAIMVIALFYSSGVSIAGLGVAALGVLLIVAMQRIGIRRPLLYVAPALVVWAGMLAAGIHPTIAGVIVGLLTPPKSWFGEEGFLHEATSALEDFSRHAHGNASHGHELLDSLDRLNQARREAVAPVVRLEAALHPWVAFGIMPLFALANAGVSLDAVDLQTPAAVSIGLGITLGLFVGKPVGIVLASYLSVKLGLASFPRAVDGKGLWLVGAVGGIGFTMALFIAQLAFTDPVKLGVAKLAVLIGSAAAGIVGMLLGALIPRKTVSGAALSPDEAERSTEA